MRRLILLILALATLLPSLASGYDVLILQSRRDPAYEEALIGFRAANSASHRVIVLADYVEVDVIRIMREDRPQLILAVGDAALKAVRPVQNTPVIVLMALGSASQPNQTCIHMLVSPEDYIDRFRAMNIRRVGVITNPAKTGWYLSHARLAAKKGGVELVVREVTTPRDALTQLTTLSGKVDALWMLPDVTAVTRETTEAYFRFGQEQNIPVISFAGSYLGLGAAAVVEINRTELGRQAGDMAAALLGGATVAGTPRQYPRGTAYKTNPAIFKRLGISFNKD
jgi:putative ABC transport system substrate-binding protein